MGFGFHWPDIRMWGFSFLFSVYMIAIAGFTNPRKEQPLRRRYR